MSLLAQQSPCHGVPHSWWHDATVLVQTFAMIVIAQLCFRLLYLIGSSPS